MKKNDGTPNPLKPESAEAAPELTRFFEAVRKFANEFPKEKHNSLRTVDNGKTIGTYVEHKLRDFLAAEGVISKKEFGSSAKGIDLPSLNMDIKVTSARQPQSSSPFTSFRQKIEGLGYGLVLFVYEKIVTGRDCYLLFKAVRYIPKERTADFQTTKGILDIIKRKGNEEDIYAFLVERMIPVDEFTLMNYSKELLTRPPVQGYLTISNAQQWRLQYQRVITEKFRDVENLDPSEQPKVSGGEVVTDEVVESPVAEE